MGANNSFEEFAAKMKAAGVNETAIRAFEHNYTNLMGGETGMIPETTIEPVTELPKLEEAKRGRRAAPELLTQVAGVKLNGGLGTSMGLERAKSLLMVKDG